MIYFHSITAALNTTKALSQSPLKKIRNAQQSEGKEWQNCCCILIILHAILFSDWHGLISGKEQCQTWGNMKLLFKLSNSLGGAFRATNLVLPKWYYCSEKPINILRGRIQIMFYYWALNSCLLAFQADMAVLGSVHLEEQDLSISITGIKNVYVCWTAQLHTRNGQ